MDNSGKRKHWCPLSHKNTNSIENHIAQENHFSKRRMNNTVGVLVRSWVVFKNQNYDTETNQFMSNEMHSVDVSTNQRSAQKKHFQT